MSLKAINGELQGAEATAQLNQILRQGSTPTVKTVSVGVARHEPVVAPIITNRQALRVLFVTTDTRLLTQATKSLDGFLSLADLFDEVHVMVLRTGIPAKNPVLRIASKSWLYTVTAKHRVGLLGAAWRLMHEHFVFADGFRPDLIVARDCFESGLLTYAAGRYFDRPTQLHLPQYMLEPKFRRMLPWWRKQIGDWCSKRFVSIRTDLESGVKLLQERFPQSTDIRVFPRYSGIQTIQSLTRTPWLTTKYPQFSFFILLMTTMEHTKLLFPVIDSLRDVLRNPRVGCVVVGSGPALADIQQRVNLLHLNEQIIFERSLSEINEHLTAASVLIVVDGEGFGDEVVLLGAAMGCPLIMTPTTARLNLFVDGLSALMVRPGNVGAITHACSVLINDPTLRHELAYHAQQVVQSQFHNNPIEYQNAYRDSIEYAIVVHKDRSDQKEI